MQSKDAGDAADVVGEVLGFVAGEGAAEKGGLAVAEPLLEDLVAAGTEVSDGFGHILLAGAGVQSENSNNSVSGKLGSLRLMDDPAVHMNWRTVGLKPSPIPTRLLTEYSPIPRIGVVTANGLPTTARLP